MIFPHLMPFDVNNAGIPFPIASLARASIVLASRRVPIAPLRFGMRD